MFNTKQFRADVRGLITEALNTANVSGFPVVYAIDKNNADRFVVFSTQDLPSMDERNQLELEINVVAPMSEQDTAEQATDVIIRKLDRHVHFTDDTGFYIYKSTRNRVDGSDPHTVRFRCTFDVYLYERNE